MRSKYGSLTSLLLTAMGEATGFFEWPLEYTDSWRINQLKGASRKSCYEAMRRMKSRGLVKIVKKDDKHFIILTREGELEKLFIKAKITKTCHWDGKWRIIIFDIPEDARDKRDQLRRLLKINNFLKLQASVFINPFPLNREAVLYLNESGLANYIRIIRVDEMDNDKELRKKFNLSKVNNLTNSRP